MSEELRPCPFCGGEAHVYKNNLWHVACERAHNECVTMSAFVTEAEAIAAWNKRADTEYGWTVPATDENMAKYGWVRERTCKPQGEWERMSQTQEIRHIYCECGEYFGADERDSFPFAIETKAVLPNYCPNCGAKVVGE